MGEEWEHWYAYWSECPPPLWWDRYNWPPEEIQVLMEYLVCKTVEALLSA